MQVGKGGAHEFLGRLDELIQADEEGPDIVIATDAITTVGEDGKRVVTENGAEAILIVRGPSHNVKRAIAKLLALIETQ